MTDETSAQDLSGGSEDKDPADSKADALAMVVVYGAAVAMAIHFVSGWTFDF